MKLTTEIEDPKFGFTWGENEDFTYLRHPDGKIKKVDERFPERLKELVSTDQSAEEGSDEEHEILEGLREEGYIYDGPVYRLDKQEINILPRVSLFAVLFVVNLYFVYRSAIQYFKMGFSEGIPPEVFIVMLGALYTIIAVHEYGHYVATRDYVPVSAGVGTINGIVPAAITDTSEMWMMSRNSRIWVNLAGPTVQMIGSIPLYILFYLHPNNPWIIVPTYFITLLIIISLFPLYHGDGYLLLCDLVGEQNIKQKGKRDFKERKPSWYSLYTTLSYATAPVTVVLEALNVYAAFQTWIAVAVLLLGHVALIVVDVGDLRPRYLVNSQPEWADKIQNSVEELASFETLN